MCTVCPRNALLLAPYPLTLPCSHPPCLPLIPDPHPEAVRNEARASQDFSALIPPQFWHLMAEGGGCVIPETELRAITLRQLQQIVGHIHTDIASEAWEYTKYGKTYHINDARRATLYDVNTKVIKPATEGRQCSMVELMADGPQRPE